jgi:hypothetical protein
MKNWIRRWVIVDKSGKIWPSPYAGMLCLFKTKKEAKIFRSNRSDHIMREISIKSVWMEK